MQDIFALLITFLIFVLLSWGIFKIIKKILKVIKSTTYSIKDNLLTSPDVKAKREEAKNLIVQLLESEPISNEQKSKALDIMYHLPISYRQEELKNFVININVDTLNFSDFDKISDLAHCLNVSTDIIDDKLYELSIIMFEKELRAGRVQNNVFTTSIPLKQNEIIYFTAPSSLIGTKTHREYKSGSHGINIKIAKGLYYRVGTSKGNSESVTQDILKSNGDLIITNKRIVFAGENQSFEIYSNKIINYLFKDEILIINTSNKNTPYRAVVSEQLKGCFDAAIQLSIKNNCQ